MAGGFDDPHRFCVPSRRSLADGYDQRDDGQPGEGDQDEEHVILSLRCLGLYPGTEVYSSRRLESQKP